MVQVARPPPRGRQSEEPWPRGRLPSAYRFGDTSNVNDELISREELTATLFSIADIREEVQSIRRILEEDDGEAQEDDA